MRRSYNREGLIRLFDKLLPSSEVDKDEATGVVDHEIFWLQVAVDNVVVVKIFKSKNNGPHKELGILRATKPNHSYNIKELHSADILKNEIQVRIIFKSSVKLHYVWMIHSFTNPLFILDMRT